MLCVDHRSGVIDREAHPLLLNLPYRPCEPSSGPQEPASERPQRYNSYCDRRVVQSLAVDGIELGETENDGDEGYPEHAYECDRPGCEAQVEGPLGEIAVVDEADEDGDAVGKVETDRGDGCGGGEGDARAEGGDGEQEGEESGEADCTDGGGEVEVDVCEEARQAAVTGETEHHAGI